MRRWAWWIGLAALMASPALRGMAAQPAAHDAAPPIDLKQLAAERQERTRLYPVGNRISRYLSAAHDEVDSGDLAEAKRLLLKLDPTRLNPLERALVYRMLAFVAYTAEDYPEAISYFDKVLGEQILPIRDEARLRFNIAQLYASLQQWKEMIAALQDWLRYVEVPDPLGFYMMGIAYYQLQDPDAAIVQASKAVELSAEPKEPWLRLLAALYAQKEDYEKAIPVLEELVLRFPKKTYWVQLSLLYGADENYRRALAVQQVAYAQGFLTEDKELRRLARSYLYNEIPYEAANVLEKGLADGTIQRDSESLELLANSWIAAREYDRSLGPLQNAAELSDEGNLYVRLGQVYMQREEWDQAATLLRKALDKGGLENPGNANLLLGIAYYNDNEAARARASFLRAREHEATRSEAERWIEHVDRELAAQEG